jgi:hypothetical protein
LTGLGADGAFVVSGDAVLVDRKNEALAGS